MTGISQLLNIGASGLVAATTSIETVSNNTANANTPGYNVEAVSQTDLPGIGVGPGSGTEVTSVQRVFDQFAYQALVAAGSANQAAQTVSANAQTLASYFPVASGGAGGLGAAIDSFFAAASTLSQHPASLPDRQALLGQAQTLTQAFNATGTQLAARLDSVNGQLTASVQQINALTQQIAAVNQQIAGQAPGNPPNALSDQRDQLVQQLGQQVGLTVLPGTNGALDVYTAGGTALVSGDTAFALTAGPGPYRDGTLAITYGANGRDLTSSLSGGTLGGLLAARAQAIDTLGSLGALAAGLAAAVNGQQSVGLDLGGQLGQALFSVAGPSVYAAATNAGSGTLTASITDPTQFTPVEFVVSKTATGFVATNTVTGQATALGSGPTLSLDGMTIAVSGTIQTGDSFKLEPTAAAAGSLALATTDPAAIAAAAAYVATPGSVTAGGAVTDTNRGNVQVSIGAPTTSGALPAGAAIVPASAFGGTLSLVFTSATAFELRGSGGGVLASGAVSPTSGAEIAVSYPTGAPAGEVATVMVSAGTAAAGDTYTLTPGGAGNNGNAAALADLASRSVISGQSLAGAYSSLVTTVGNFGQEAQASATAAQGVLTMAQHNQQSVSGVNLDEEAAHLVAFQQAYQASAQVIAAAQTLFQSLLTAVNA